MKIAIVKMNDNGDETVEKVVVSKDILHEMGAHLVFDRLSWEEKKWVAEWFASTIDGMLEESALAPSVEIATFS